MESPTTTVREQLADSAREFMVSVAERDGDQFTLQMSTHPKVRGGAEQYFILCNQMREIQLYERLREDDDITLTREMAQALFDELTRLGFSSSVTHSPVCSPG